MSFHRLTGNGSAEPHASDGALTSEPLTPPQKRTLLQLARASLEHGARVGSVLDVDVTALEPRLREEQACFVTLTRGDELRGCVGTLESRTTLAQEVVLSTFNAGFRDSRMLPVRVEEVPEIVIEISVLSPPQDLPPMSEEELLRTVQPRVDGLVLHEGALHATLLPKVWKSLPDPAVFLLHLKRKAGLPDRYWSPTIRFQKYRTECFGDADP